jgi:hypothetical protein
VKFKPILGSDLSGHIGGVVASHNTYGPYFRQRVRPVNPKTLAQQAQRSSIAAVSQTWRSLDPSVIAEWAAATISKTSRKGDKINLSGQAAFMNVNTLRRRMSLPIVSDPPTSTEVPAITTPTIAFTSATTLTITFAGDAWNAPNGGVIMSGALLTSAGKSYATPNRAIGFKVNPGTGAVSVTVPFATPIGARIRIVFHATAPDGRLSQYVSVDVTNPSFPPPSPIAVHVVSVTAYGSSEAMWLFDGDVPSITPAKLLIGGIGATGIQVRPDLRTIGLSYAAMPTTGDTWSITDPTATTPPTALPSTGSVL